MAAITNRRSTASEASFNSSIAKTHEEAGADNEISTVPRTPSPVQGTLANLPSRPPTPAGTSGSAGPSRRQSRASISASAANAPETIEMKSATERAEGIKKLLDDYFKPHIIEEGENSNKAAIEALIKDRTEGLVRLNQTADTIKDTMSKLSKHDWAAVLAHGFVASVPFGAASRVLDKVPVVGETLVAGINKLPGLKNAPDAFKAGAAGGFFAGVADHVGTKMRDPSMKGIEWLNPPAERLPPVMKKAKESLPPPGMLANAAKIQTFSLRNLARTVVEPLVNHFNSPQAGVETDSWMAAVGSPLAGAAFYGLRALDDKNHHRTGPEYLFSQDNWEEQFNAAQAVTWPNAASNGLGRLGKAVVDAARATFEAPHTITTKNDLAALSALTFGGGMVNLVADATSKAMGATTVNGATNLFVSKLAGDAAATVEYGAWAESDKWATSAVDALNTVGNKIGDTAQTAISAAARTTAQATANTLSAAYQGTTAAASSALDALGNQVTEMQMRRRNQANAQGTPSGDEIV